MINSKKYWEERFDNEDKKNNNWDNLGGQFQSEFFMENLIRNLPNFFLNEIKKEKYSIIDFGCASGDGTNILKNYFKGNNIFGCDFSENAIKTAKERYDDINFFVSDGLNKVERNKYDILITSNVLEHFDNPEKMMLDIFKYKFKYVIIMVPFQEFERSLEHVYTFNYSDFKNLIDENYLEYFKIIDTSLLENTYWNGKQAILIYSKEKTAKKIDEIIGNIFDIDKTMILEKDLEKKTQDMQNLKEILLKNQKELEKKEQELNQIYNSNLWKLAKKYYKIRDFIRNRR